MSDKKIKIVFLGTPEFAVASLDILVKNNYEIAGVVTAPDKRAGRGQDLHQSPVKKYALEHSLKLFQPENLKDTFFEDELRLLQAELFIVVAFRMLPESVWKMPVLGTFNLHASLLPKYRGAAPINRAIINGETETGLTTFKLKQQIDTGNVLFQEKVNIDALDNAGTLHNKLMIKGAQLILKSVEEIEMEFNGFKKIVFTEQNNSEASHALKIFKENCKINWNNSVVEIHNLVRGLSPYPGAYCDISISGNKCKVLKIFVSRFEIVSHTNPNGLHLSDGVNYLKIYGVDGYLEIIELQLEGKKRMQVKEFLKGFKLTETMKFL